MRIFIYLSLFLLPLLSNAQLTPNSREFEMKDGDTTYVMKKYWFVMLVRGDKADGFTKEEIAKLQEGHMTNINAMADAGKLMMAGPMGDDGNWRGIFVIDVDTQEEVEELLKNDPAIAAGRLRAEIHPWWCAKGTTLK
jgi:uncharacterized protein